MSQSRDPPGGLSFREAFFEFTDPEKYEAWEEAHIAWLDLQPPPELPRDSEWAKLLPPYEVVSKPKPDKQKLQETRRRRDHTFAVACEDITGPLRSGELVAFGFPGAMSAKEGRSQIATGLWKVMRIRSKPMNWDKVVLEGGGQIFHDVRFHRAGDLEEWKGGARLPLAWRALMPLPYANYQAFWAEEGGSYDRLEFWAALRAAAIAEDCTLSVLPLADPSAKWTPITRDFLEAMPRALEIDEKKSTVGIPDGGVYAIRVFLPGQFDQPGRHQNVVPSATQGYVEQEPRHYVGTLGQKVRQAIQALRGRGIAIAPAAVYDELVASGLKPNRETVGRYVRNELRDFQPS